MQPTEEQALAKELFDTGVTLAIEAGAGTGKTTTLKQLASSTPKSGTYAAFNKAIVQDAHDSMPSNVQCRTAHSLAFRSTGVRYKHRLDSARMKSHEVAKRLGLERTFLSLQKGDVTKVLQPSQLAGWTMQAITRFCQSADERPGPEHVPYIEGIDEPDSEGRRTFENNARVRHELRLPIEKAWADIQSLDGQLRFSHDHYLKLWQLNDPKIPGDFVLFDEAQDAAPVMLAAVEAQDAQLVFVGDSQQQIYEWRGAVNALDRVNAEAKAYLSESFRFGPAIADVANRVLTVLAAELRLTGRGGPSVIDSLSQPSAILTRSNAHAVERVMQLQRAAERPHLVGGGKDVIYFAEGAQQLKYGQRTAHPELQCFETWGEVQAYVEDDPQGGELKLLVNLVDEFGVDAILAALKQMPDEREATVVVSTAHKSKGREWDHVQLAADFALPGDDALGEWRLLYVAATRAKRTLDLDLCEPLRDLVTLGAA